MKIIVPMAGLGSRFQKAADHNPEYKKPKPFISVKGKPMILWAIESFPFVDLPRRSTATSEITVSPKDLVFVCRREHQETFQITDKLKDIFSSAISVVLIDRVTRGAAETALKAKDIIDGKEDLIVSDSDHFFDGTSLYHKIRTKDKATEGIIPVFQPPTVDAKWSFSLIAADERIVAVGEKDLSLAKRGAYANIGGYYFTHGEVFIREVEETIQKNDLSGEEGKKEFYIAPIYQGLIKKGKKIVAAKTPKVWGLGTPSDLQFFEEQYQSSETSSG